MRGSSPYYQDELSKTRQALSGTLATKPSYPFGYPPSAIPACVLLSLLPWEGAQALWKLLNVAFLIGSVLLTFRMFSNLQFTQRERYLVWAFAFVFSPTVSVLLVGQSSLFVLFTVLLTVVLCDLGKSWTAGFGLALALTKPHLAFSLVFLLLFRRRYRITIIGIVVFVALGIGGLYLGHSSLDAYLQGLRGYASWNGAAGNPRLVGIQSLATRALGLSDSVGRTLSGVCGLLLLGVTLLLDSRARRRHHTEDVLPLLLLVSVLAFGAHSYDLVFLIPVCVWAIGRVKTDRTFLPIVILCFLLIIPLSVVTIAYEDLLAGSTPQAFFRAVIEPYRSWILLVMSVLLTHLTYRRVIAQREFSQP